jgi:hypothetical protein
MKITKRIVVAMLTGLMALTVFAGSAQAADQVMPQPEASSETTIEPRIDVIVRKYRYYNGKLQYRRWNETYGYWVDPYWIDM